MWGAAGSAVPVARLVAVPVARWLAVLVGPYPSVSANPGGVRWFVACS